MQRVVDYVFGSQHDPSLAPAFGLTVIYNGPVFEGTLARITEKRGIPSIIVEIGGGSVLDDHYIDLGVRGTFNVLKSLDMLDGEPVVPGEQFTVTELKTIRPQAGGVLYPEIGPDQLGKVVPGGTILGRVISPYTFEELEVLRAPFARSLLVLLRSAVTPVNPGDYAFMAANPDA